MSEVNEVASPSPIPQNFSQTQVKSSIFPSIPVESFQKISLTGNLILAAAGLLAGIFYFYKRLSVENNRDKVSRIREHSKILLSLIDDYDKCITSSINNQAMKTMGKTRRDEISRLYRSIQHFLESNQNLIGFKEVEIQDLMEFHSIIDNSKLSRGKTAQGSQSSVKTEYAKALKKAREICWKKMF